MRVLLTNPAVVFYGHSPSEPLGTLCIGSYLEEIGHTVKITDRSVKIESLKKICTEFKPEAVGISFMSISSITDGIKMCRYFHKKGLPVIAGGMGVTSLYKEALADGSIDYVIMGEGEITFAEILTLIQNGGNPEEIDGLAFVKNGKVIKTKNREFADLGSLPQMHWNLINPKRYFQRYIGCKKMLYIYSGKGCPGNCTFCFNERYNRRCVRKRPNDTVLSEIKTLVNEYGVDGIYFSDAAWCPSKSEMRDFCNKAIESNLNFVWGAQTRIDFFSLEDFELMYKAGCRWLFFGIESGSQTVLDRMNKGAIYNDISTTIENCHKVGITSIASFIIGYIDETQEELQQTVDIIKAINANITNVNILSALPDTEVYDYAVKNGLLVPPKTILDWPKEFPMAESPDINYSKVPDIDLMVLRHYFRCNSFFKSDSSAEDKSFEIMKKSVIDELRNIFTHSLFSFFFGLFHAAKELFTTLFYAKCFPKVLKKYGLK